MQELIAFMLIFKDFVQQQQELNCSNQLFCPLLVFLDMIFVSLAILGEIANETDSISKICLNIYKYKDFSILYPYTTVGFSWKLDWQNKIPHTGDIESLDRCGS